MKSQTTAGLQDVSQGLDQLEPSVLPFLPMIYVAWADSDLTTTELESVREKIKSQPWLNAASQQWLDQWLDPEAPPSPSQLQALLTTIQRLAQEAPESARSSLTELGLKLCETRDGAVPPSWATPEARRALVEIEQAIGVLGSEACRELLPLEEPVEEAVLVPRAAFEVAAMAQLLDGEYQDVRETVRSLLRDPMFRYEYELDSSQYRDRVLSWCRELAKRGLGAMGYPEAFGGGGDQGRFVTVFEMLGFHDFSLVVKFGVQFGLFGGSILFLGTKRHHEKYLRDVGTLALPGCFAMTELGHGSNVREIETVARFERETDEFVIHTTSESARKDYIGNAARHGRMATVFAQLEIEDVHYGVHAFLVPIRQDDGTPCPGVRIEDSGHKLGLNGVDNGRIWFDHVRIPRENLLNRFSDVDADGAYSSTIPSASKRFFTMIGTLVGGRVSVATASLSAAKSGLAIAIRYGATRRQFGPAGAQETTILDYLTHQRRLMPPLATTYALDFALKYLVRRFLRRSDADGREVEALAAGLKAYSTWQTVQTLQVCRESCGGQGYLTVNRFASLKADTDVFTTFEGDNTVLMQLLAKGLLTDYKQQFGELRVFGVLKYVARRAATAVAELNPVVTRLTDEQHLRDPEFQLGAFRYREQRLLVSVAGRLKGRIDDGMDSFVALNECQDHLVMLAHAHVERVILEQFIEGVNACDDRDLATMLKTLNDLFALSRLEADGRWFLESGYLAAVKSKAIRTLVNALCREVRAQATPLVDAFGIPDEMLAAPIAVEVGHGNRLRLNN